MNSLLVTSESPAPSRIFRPKNSHHRIIDSHQKCDSLEPKDYSLTSAEWKTQWLFVNKRHNEEKLSLFWGLASVIWIMVGVSTDT